MGHTTSLDDVTINCWRDAIIRYEVYSPPMDPSPSLQYNILKMQSKFPALYPCRATMQNLSHVVKNND